MSDINISEDTYDIIIVGGGPGGLTAGLYTSRADMKVLLLEGNAQASQITMTDMIENYPGVPEISGFGLNDTFKKQALSFGLEIKPEQVNLINRKKSGDVEGWEVITDSDVYQTLREQPGAAWEYQGSRSLSVEGYHTAPPVMLPSTRAGTLP